MSSAMSRSVRRSRTRHRCLVLGSGVGRGLDEWAIQYADVLSIS